MLSSDYEPRNEEEEWDELDPDARGLQRELEDRYQLEFGCYWIKPYRRYE